MQCLGKHIVMTGSRFSSNPHVIKKMAVRVEVGGITETLVSIYTTMRCQSSKYKNISTSTK